MQEKLNAIETDPKEITPEEPALQLPYPLHVIATVFGEYMARRLSLPYEEGLKITPRQIYEELYGEPCKL